MTPSRVLLLVWALAFVAGAGCRPGECQNAPDAPDSFCQCRAGASCTHSCAAGSPCTLSCNDRNTRCAVDCGDDCSALCQGAQECQATCGERCQVACQHVGACTATVGADATVSCDGASSCSIRCGGRCSVGCDEGRCRVECADPASCQVSCGRADAGAELCPDGKTKVCRESC